MTYEAFRFAEKEAWDVRAATYDNFTGQVTTGAIPTLLALAETAPGKHMLDLCCGTGRVAGAASALGAVADGLDISSAMIDRAKAAFPSIPFEVGDAETIPRETGHYDGVICSFGIMHIGNTEAMLKDVARVLKPGGRVALSHWIGPPASPLFRIVFGAMQQFADMSVVPPAPAPFALSTEEAMRATLEKAGFRGVACVRLPLTFTAPAGEFVAHFRKFAGRAAVILDKQEDDVLKQIYDAWDSQLEEYLVEDAYQVPMPALAVSAVRE